ncbi:hypothetical protein ACQP06_18830 [Nocardia sp. CA-136227]|uniref:hypothetical protein n=1 Tax=Nocardia sp. CA-136227 TaxID=3239979 RepID=UPI003D984488
MAIDPQVIARVRAIRLPASALLATTAAQRAVDDAVAEMAAAQQLRPDTSALADNDEIYRSPMAIVLAELSGRVVSEPARRASEQMTVYRVRCDDVRSSLQAALAQEYLANMAVQVRDRLLGKIATSTGRMPPSDV